MNANVPITYKGILNLLNFSLKVPESTADGITAWAITRDGAAMNANTRHAHIILSAFNLVTQSSLVKIPGSKFLLH